jgi:SAM-dependent methyltransferase
MASLFEILGTLADPIVFLLLSAAFLPLTILRLILSLQICTLLSPSLFQHAWLANFWRVIGPLIARNSRPQVKPLIYLAEGVVLDIGPGNGEWLSLFDKSKITKIYGIEPNTDHHEVLRERIKRAGLDGKYEIVPVGVEDLGSDWVSKKSVDTVITVHCLCSVPEPKRMIRELYEYLKIGGRWIVYEHVVVYGHQGSFMRKYQGKSPLRNSGENKLM